MAEALQPGQRLQGSDPAQGQVGESLPDLVRGEFPTRSEPLVHPVHRAQDARRGELGVHLGPDQPGLLARLEEVHEDPAVGG